MIKNMIDSRRVLGADATTDTEGVARRQAVSGFPPESRLRKATAIFKFTIGSREKLGISSFYSPFNDLRRYRGSEGCRVRMWRGIRLWASPRYSLRIDESRTQTLVSYGGNEIGCRFYCLTDRYYIAIFTGLNQR